MKAISPHVAAFFVALLPATQATEWASLSGTGDSIDLKAGEAAFIVSATDSIVVRFDKPGRHMRMCARGVRS